MSDKDLLVVISEMLRKQDQHSELLLKQSETLEKIGSSLNNFIEISINQFEQQQKFNEKFLGNFEQQRNFNEKFLGNFEQQQNFNEKFLGNFKQQQVFNEKFLEKLDTIGDVSNKNQELEKRTNKLESAVFKSDNGNSK